MRRCGAPLGVLLGLAVVLFVALMCSEVELG